MSEGLPKVARQPPSCVTKKSRCGCRSAYNRRQLSRAFASAQLLDFTKCLISYHPDTDVIVGVENLATGGVPDKRSWKT